MFRSNESLPNAEPGSKRVDDLLHWEITNFKIHQFRPGHGFLAALAVTAGEVRLLSLSRADEDSMLGAPTGAGKRRASG